MCVCGGGGGGGGSLSVHINGIIRVLSLSSDIMLQNTH